jgi:hypothetical protein
VPVKPVPGPHRGPVRRPNGAPAPHVPGGLTR